VLDANDNLVSVAVADVGGDANQPAGWIDLDESVSTALDALEAALPPGESTLELLSGLRRAYKPGIRMTHAFAQWLETLLGPLRLVVFDASDPAAKPLVAELFARAVESGVRLGRDVRILRERGTVGVLCAPPHTGRVRSQRHIRGAVRLRPRPVGRRCEPLVHRRWIFT
jgi:uncharacterized protein YllA (UPF0747 family)